MFGQWTLQMGLRATKSLCLTLQDNRNDSSKRLWVFHCHKVTFLLFFKAITFQN